MGDQTETNDQAPASAEIFDAVVIGTGFGGAVAACRLAQAGKKICVLERGRRYGLGDFPRPAHRRDHLPHTARWAWALDHGLFDFEDLQGMLAVQAAGYGGGSLIYANVHLRPPPQVFARPTRHGPSADGWPEDYSRDALEPYYDVVAAALRVQPLPATPSPTPVPKADAMRAVAKALHREDWFFLPPLAIDFDKCVRCGECVAGCQLHAKNTLDLNYLAAAEEAGDVDVRTLAEASDIREEGDGSYTVTYHDHIVDADRVAVRAKSVFLCAGALNSTHLLLRSADGLPNVPAASKGQIGRRFFGNGDAIAMIFDTTKEPAPKPTQGPTITTTLVYAGAAPEGGGTPADWFVLQEGGYPVWLAPALGFFRGEFWLGQNRVVPAQGTAARFNAQAARAFADQAGRIGRAVHGLMDARGAFRGRRARLQGRGIAGVLPPQIGERVVPHLEKYARDLEAREANTVSRKVLAEISRRVTESKPWLKCLVKISNKLVEPELLPSTLKILDQYFLKAPRGTPDPFTPAVLWPLLVAAGERLFFDWRPDDHALLMLAVGVDAAPGRLFTDDSGRLRAYWDLADNVPFSTAQERLVQDVAKTLGGELRLNPDTTARQRPVTVHCLGGCAMADSPEDGVTDSNGKVWGTRALYVLDGAAIPSSLGTNPSATIAAIAERNVRKALGDRQSPLHAETPVPPLDRRVPGWPDEMTVAEIRQRLGQSAKILDPIAVMPAPPSPSPSSPPLGLKFEEAMQGFYSTGAADNVRIHSQFVATVGDLNAFLADPRHRVGITGKVTLSLPPGPGGRSVEYDAQGTLDLLRPVQSNKAMRGLFDEALSLLSAPRSTPVDALAMELEALLGELRKQSHRYEMAYELKLVGPAPWTDFKGLKRVYGGPGLDAWTQTTTLELTLLGVNGAQARGTMHVHLADFLSLELPSFEITGTDDDVRIAWAFGRFFRFFFGTLRQVYLPGIDSLDPFGPRRS